MGKAFRASAALALAAMLGTAASPALADRGWYGGGHHGWHHDHDDGFGTFLGIAALFGAVAVIASSADKNARAARARDEGYDNAPASSEDAAVDDCTVAARAEGSQDGYSADVRDISGTEEIEGGWNVAGTIDQRDSYNGESEARRFTCAWRDGRVAEVHLGGDSIALR